MILWGWKTVGYRDKQYKQVEENKNLSTPVKENNSKHFGIYISDFFVCTHVVLLFSCSVSSDSLQPHRLQHSRLCCPSLLSELAQTHVHWNSDAIQPSYPLFFPSPPAFNLSQHQGLFQWVSSLHQVAKVLPPQLQHQSFQWIFKVDLGLTDLISLQLWI